MKKETAARYLVRILVKNHIEKVFCVPGERYLPVLDALYDEKGRIDLIPCRQESRTGKQEICFATRGPVVLALPEDMLKDEIVACGILPAQGAHACISPDDLKTLRDALCAAKNSFCCSAGRAGIDNL